MRSVYTGSLNYNLLKVWSEYLKALNHCTKVGFSFLVKCGMIVKENDSIKILNYSEHYIVGSNQVLIIMFTG